MRIYSGFKEALNEIRRDVAEMGIDVHPHSWQDKIVKDMPEFDTKEVQNYMYSVTSPNVDDLNPVQPWADGEFAERIAGAETGKGVNPGEAYKDRYDVWQNFLTEEGKFGYSYSERFAKNLQVQSVINRILTDPDSRQLWISIWEPDDIKNLGGISRVPCSLGYQVQVRQGVLNLTYIQRSADLVTHFENDVWMAHMMQRYISEKTGIPIGVYTHIIFSLHMFRKDAEGIF